MPVICGYCERSFGNEKDLSQHSWAKHNRSSYIAEYSCDWCPRTFNSEHSASQHETAKHLLCHFCDREFSTPHGQRNHQAAKHPGTPLRCNYCPDTFDALYILRWHESNFHQTTFECCNCEQEFKSEAQLDNHKCKAAVRALIDTLTCDICDKTFGSERAVEQHKESGIHNPFTPGLKCFGKGCNKTFSTPSAMVMHLESGACKSKTTKAKLDAAVCKNDTAGVITVAGLGGLSMETTRDINAVELLEYKPDEVLDSHADTPASFVTLPADKDNEGRHADESTSDAIVPYSPTTGVHSEIVTPKSDSSAYFDVDLLGERLSALTVTETTSIDDGFLYRCPPAYFFGLNHSTLHEPERRFRTLSALAQHIEKGSCSVSSKNGMLKAALRLMETTLVSAGLQGYFVKYLREA